MMGIDEKEEERVCSIRRKIIQRRENVKQKEKEEKQKLIWRDEIAALGYPTWRKKQIEKKEREQWEKGGGGGDAEWAIEKDKRTKLKAKEQEEERLSDRRAIVEGLVRWREDETAAEAEEKRQTEKKKKYQKVPAILY